MYAGMGANDQRLYVVPSQGLIVVRMGDVAFEASTALSGFDNELWQRIANLECETLATENNSDEGGDLKLYPNPATSFFSLAHPEDFQGGRIFNMAGIRVWEGTESDLRSQINLQSGMYIMEADLHNGGKRTARIVVL